MNSENCPKCFGKGVLYNKKCPYCDGTGKQTKKQQTLKDLWNK